MSCNITGYLYLANASTVTSGVLHVTLQQDMILGGSKITPTKISYNLANAAPAGYIDITLYPTEGATPSGLSYFVEFDPLPSDSSRPISSKDGYWSNYWVVPDVASKDIGSFEPALRGAAAYNYITTTSAAYSAGTPVEYITGNKSLSSGDSGKAVVCDGTARTITLPTPSLGLSFSVHANAATGNHVIAGGAGVSFKGYAGSVSTNLTRAAAAAGEYVKLAAGNATTWWILEKVGTWE